MNWLLLAIVGYVLVQFAVGTWVSRRMASEADYILAGRRLGTALVTFSVFATYFGAEAIVASGGAVYDNGLAGALVDPVGYAAAIIIVGVFFARALWSRGLTTFADLFRQRYSAGVERLVVVVLLPGSVIWAAAQVRAFGQVMDENSGMGLKSAILLAAVLVAAYSVVGGLLADAVTDVIQGIAVLAGLIILGAIVAGHVGGVSAGLAQVEPQRLKVFGAQESLVGTLEKIAIPICGTIVAVELISRFLGARSAQVAVNGTAIGGGIYLIVGMVPVFLGLVGPGLLPNVQDSEQIVAKLAKVYLPGLLYIAFAGAIISAILSTVHSALHAPASQISHNIVVRLDSRHHRSRQALVRAPHGHGAQHRRLSPLRHVRAHPRPGGDGIGLRQRRGVRDGAVCALRPLRRARERLHLGGGRHARLGGGQVRPQPHGTLLARVVGGLRGLRRRGAAGDAARLKQHVASLLGRWHFAAPAALCPVSLNPF